MSRKPYTKAILILLAERGITQTYLAKMAGYSKAHFNHIIHGRKPSRNLPPARLDPYRAPIIARELKVPISRVLYLWGLSQEHRKVLGPSPNVEVLV